MSDAAHWDEAYDRLGSTGVSWFQRSPDVSRRLVERLDVSPGSSIIDVGGGESTLVDTLLEGGADDVSVLDLSAIALAGARMRLGAEAGRVRWIRGDVRGWEPDHAYAVWHDRALFHFMVTPPDIAAYLRAARAAVALGGHMVMGTFAADGPTRCSGLPVARYAPDDLAATVGDDFSLIDCEREEHRTPSGTVQAFTWVTLRRSHAGSQDAGERNGELHGELRPV